MVIKGVPIELQTAYNQQPENYLLLGLMADAADEAGEFEVGEALRWLWRWQIVPEQLPLRVSAWGFSFSRNPVLEEIRLFFISPSYRSGDTPTAAVFRLITGFPKWKAQHSEEYHRLSVPPSTLTPQTTPS